MALAEIIVAGLAVFRLAQLLVLDDGPFAVFARWRFFLGRRAAGAPKNGIWWTLAELFQCEYCLALWLAIPPAAVIGANHVGATWELIWKIPAAWFAIAGIQAFLQGAIDAIQGSGDSS